MSAPSLRFNGFLDDWESKKIDRIAHVSSGGTPSRANQSFWNGNIPWVTTSEVKFNVITDTKEKITDEGLKNSSAKVFPKNTLLIAMYGQGKTRGQVAKLGIDASTNQACAAIQLKKDHNPDFFFQYLQNQYDNLRDLSNDGGQKNLNAFLIKNFEVSFPDFKEQTKIATFLTAVDDKIAQLTKKSELLATYKKGVMQKIFSREIRFRDENGLYYQDWEPKKLNELLFEKKERNYDLTFNKTDVLSVSGDYGIINQIDFKGRSFAGESVHNYHVVKTGDIVYTKSPLKLNPYGIIKVNKGNPGIVSTLYAVYGCKEGILGEYLDYYFQLHDNVNSYLRPLVHKGAKNDMKINNYHVLSGSIVVPIDIKEQQKIVSFLAAIDKKIKISQSQLNAMKKYKQGLLQQMLV